MSGLNCTKTSWPLSAVPDDAGERDRHESDERWPHPAGCGSTLAILPKPAPAIQTGVSTQSHQT